MPFKESPFFAETTVVPVILKYNYYDCLMHPPTDQLTPWQIAVLNWSSWYWNHCNLRITVKFFPPFQPNEYLFENHKDRGDERWKIFGWAVQDAMIGFGRFLQEPDNKGHEERERLLSYLEGKSSVFELEPDKIRET